MTAIWAMACNLSALPSHLRYHWPPRRQGSRVMQERWKIAGVALAWAVAHSASAAQPQRAYVANEHDGTVSEIDTQEDDVRRTIAVHGKSGDKLQAAVAERGGKWLFVVDAQNSEVAVVDLSTSQVVERIPVGKSPEGASLSPSGKELAV